MNIIQAIIYGIVQGITEFLPVSSTAHLTLLPWLLGWKDPGVVFDVADHLGTAAAVILFFLTDWVKLVHAGLTAPKTSDGRLFWMVVLATVPGAVFGVFLDQYMSNVRNPLLIGAMLILMGLVLYFADRFGRKEIEINHIHSGNSLIIGFAQVFAVVPGVSRSGITMTVGRFLGIKREDIAKFTFLMSAPIILGDGLYHAKEMVHTTIPIAPFIAAVITSAVVGMLSIKFLLNFLKTKGFTIFAVYRFLFGASVIFLFLFRSRII